MANRWTTQVVVTNETHGREKWRTLAERYQKYQKGSPAKLQNHNRPSSEKENQPQPLIIWFRLRNPRHDTKRGGKNSANLHPISATQIDWYTAIVFEHRQLRTKKGNITVRLRSSASNSDHATMLSMVAPAPNAVLNAQGVRTERTHRNANFSAITTCKGYQLTVWQ